MGKAAKPDFPSSDAFWNAAQGYRDAGDAAWNLIRSDTYVGMAVIPTLFLYFRSIELALKACLVSHGYTETQITKTLGHRLSRLIDEMAKHVKLPRIGITAADRSILNKFSDYYSNKKFEYPDDLLPRHPGLDRLKSLAGRVCDATQSYKLNSPLTSP